jgi:ABC-2 type transport system permease protein
MDPDADARKIDFTFAVMAHEIAHQWWGSNQLSPAAVAGAPFIAESLAWYSALGVIADAKGEAHLDRFLDVMREGYLTPRARDGVPLLEAADWFTAYRRGPFSMVALRDAVGEAPVNLALRRFMQKHGGARPPLPTSLDLYAELKAVTPVAQHELLADLFERNTYWNLRTHTVSAEPVGNAWRVTLEVSADKVSVDRQGKETVRPLDEPIDIGVYGAGSELAQGATLYLRKHRLHSGVQRITVTVPSRPATAGIDPRNVLIDTLRSDNVIAVVAKS